MKIRQLVGGAKNGYELTLSRKDIETLLDRESTGVMSPKTADNTQFQIFPHKTKCEPSFIGYSTGSIYFTYFGGEQLQTYQDIVAFITSKNRMPIYIKTLTSGKKTHIGDVVLKIEED